MSKQIKKILIPLATLVITTIPVYLIFIHPWPQTVEGTIRDSATSSTIRGAKVSLADHTFITGDDGKYYFEEAVKPRRYQIRVEKEEYEAYSGAIVVRDETIIHDIEITLKRQPPLAAMVRIDVPQQNAFVPQLITVSGVASAVPSDHHYWIVVHPIESSGWWPQSSEFSPNLPDSSWRVQANLGKVIEDKGKVFEITAVLANQDAHGKFVEYLQHGIDIGEYPEVPRPSGTEIIAQVTVTRE